MKRDDNFLLYVPVIRHKYFKEEKGKIYLVFHHNKLIEKAVRGLFKKSHVTDIELDEIGSAVWRLIDGKRSILEIIRKLEETFNEPITKRLILYMSYLNKKNWVYFQRLG